MFNNNFYNGIEEESFSSDYTEQDIDKMMEQEGLNPNQYNAEINLQEKQQQQHRQKTTNKRRRGMRR